jgi:phosphoglucosamine mutase
MEQINERYSEVFREVNSVNTMDGIRLEMPSGWVLIRPSGTEPLIRITVEGLTQIDVEKIMDKAKQLVKQVIE